jgi:hypothetical protein
MRRAVGVDRGDLEVAARFEELVDLLVAHLDGVAPAPHEANTIAALYLSAVAKNPDPSLKLTSLKGVTRTLDDWSTMFHLTLVILPARPEASAWLPVARRIFRTFGDADCRTAYCVPGPPEVARRILADAADEALVFVDSDRTLIESLGLERLPAFVHLRQDTTLVAAAEGWDPREWQHVAREVGKAMAWTVPEVTGAGDPPATPGWPA